MIIILGLIVLIAAVVVIGLAGAIATAGLSLLLAGARRTSRRGSAARRRLRQSRQETAAVSRDRDDLAGQRETARAYTAGTPGNGTPLSGSYPGPDEDPGPDDRRRGSLHLFGHRLAPRQAAAGSAEPLNGQVVPDVPADTPAP
jgi:type II secretory pathway pseudopilin PulG